MSKDQITPDRLAELLAIEKQAQYLVTCKGRYNAEQAMNKLAELFGKPAPYPDHIADSGNMVSDARIREICEANGHRAMYLGNGAWDLPPYVYEAARAIAADVAPRWRSTCEQPPTGDPIVLIDIYGGVCCIIADNDCFRSSYFCGWMPLPPPPKESSNG